MSTGIVTGPEQTRGRATPRTAADAHADINRDGLVIGSYCAGRIQTPDAFESAARSIIQMLRMPPLGPSAVATLS